MSNLPILIMHDKWKLLPMGARSRPRTHVLKSNNYQNHL